jgi:hypothetical protein
MPGGRPEQGKQKVHAELAELSAWLRQALGDAGFASVNEFVQRHAFEKNQVYGLFRGSRFLTLESTQAVAVALRRRPDEIDVLWWRAKEAIERNAVAERDTRRLTTWSEIPWPDLALQDLLEAQCGAVEQLPYRLLGVEAPPLSTVYVRQRARSQTALKHERVDLRGELPDDRDRFEPGETDVVVEMAEALRRHEHLLVTGEPGAGKSTFGQYFALHLARIWLRQSGGTLPLMDEPVVPLRVAARFLVGSATWSEALATAACQTLGMRLVANPPTALFERSVHGARWLVIVDGLDEIVERTARDQVIQAIAAHSRSAGNYRVIVTTRKLPDAEFAPLRAQHFGQYAMEPFGRGQLETFARQWFTAQGVQDPEATANQFLHQTDSSRVRDLVANPLLATIAAISHTLEPHRPLPTGRLELYERFFTYLVDDEANGRATLSELRRLQTAHPSRHQLAEWIYHQRLRLIRHLAVTRLADERPLGDVAEQWVAANAPQDLSVITGWSGDLEQLLISTGLFVYEGVGPRFLHQSFAEYLAADDHADRISADFPALDSWIARGLKDAERGFVLFVFTKWAARPGNDIGLIVRRLLATNPERALLAGRLVAELPVAPDALVDEVVERLVALAVGSSLFESSDRTVDFAGQERLSVTPVSSIVDVLGILAERTATGSRLASLVESSSLPLHLRIEAAIALGHVTRSPTAGGHLKRFATIAFCADRVRVAQGLRQHASDDPLIETLLTGISRDVSVLPARRMDAAQELVDMSSLAAAGILAELVRDPRLDPYSLRTALSAYLRTATEADRQSMVDDLRTRTVPTAQHRLEISKALSEAGFRDVAHMFASSVLDDLDCPGWRLDEVVVAYLTTADQPDPDQMMARIAGRLTTADLGWVIVGLADAGFTETAVTAAAEAMDRPDADGFDLQRVAKAWLTASSQTAKDTIRERLHRRATEPTLWHGQLVSAFTDIGDRDGAIAFARRLVASPETNGSNLQFAIDGWLNLAGPAGETELRGLLESRRLFSGWEYATVAQVCADHGLTETAMSLSRRVIESALDSLYLGTAVKAWMTATGPSGASELIASISARHLASTERMMIADHFAAAGALDDAQQLWREVLVAPDAARELKAVAEVRLAETDTTGGGGDDVDISLPV